LSNKIETTNGVNINVEDLGGTGNPVVFIHGWPVNYNMFEYQFIKSWSGCVSICYYSLCS
jgi:pimeloyl-ACP methyl ester carboxylesterase